jgi:hypothetical protein
MYKLQFLVLLLLFSVSCKQNKPKPLVIKKGTLKIEVKKDVIKDSISGYINPKLGLYSFKFDLDTAHLKLKKIKIYSDGKLVQTIKTNKECEHLDFSLIDWNFDGYKDITAIYNCGSGGCAYWIWNYSPKLNKFVYNTVLSERLGLEIDLVSKCIVFHFRDGVHLEYWDTMKYCNNKLVLVKGFTQKRWFDKDGNIWLKEIHKKVIHGVVRRTVDSMMIMENKKTK